MTRRHRVLAGGALPLLVVVGIIVVTAGGPARAGTEGGADDAAAVLLLRRAVAASSGLAYRGTQLVAVSSDTGSDSWTVTVEQDGSGDRTVSTLRTGDGTGTTRSYTAGVEDLADLIVDAFTVTRSGTATVVGRAATVVRLERSGRLAARLWIDDGTALPLREEVVDSDGRVVRTSAFLDLTVAGTAVSATGAAAAEVDEGTDADGEADADTGAGTDADGEADADTGAGTDADGEADADAGAGTDTGTDADADVDGSGATAPDGLSAAGVTGCTDPSLCPDELPGGFALVSVTPWEQQGTGGEEASDRAVELTYTDGLSTLSLFVQDGELAGTPEGTTSADWDGLTVHVGTGWPERVTWQARGAVVSAVFDAPEEDVRTAVAALPTGDASVLGRVRTALETLVGAAA